MSIFDYSLSYKFVTSSQQSYLHNHFTDYFPLWPLKMATHILISSTGKTCLSISNVLVEHIAHCCLRRQPAFPLTMLLIQPMYSIQEQIYLFSTNVLPSFWLGPYMKLSLRSLMLCSPLLGHDPGPYWRKGSSHNQFPGTDHKSWSACSEGKPSVHGQNSLELVQNLPLLHNSTNKERSPE